jgi:hypothetical protein
VSGRLDLLGPASDVYGLGATLYALLTGRPPVAADELEEVLRRVQKGEILPPRSLDPTIPKPLEAICLKAMALKPEDRYPSPRVLAEDVTRWLDDAPVSAWREPLGTRVSRWSRRHQTAVSVVAACSLMALLFLWLAAVRAARQARIVADYEIAAVRQAQILANYGVTAEALVDVIEIMTDPERPGVVALPQSPSAIVPPAPPRAVAEPVVATATPVPVHTQQALEALRHRFQDIKSRLETGGQGQMAMRVEAIIKRYDTKIKQQLGSSGPPFRTAATPGPAGFGGGLEAAETPLTLLGD